VTSPAALRQAVGDLAAGERCASWGVATVAPLVQEHSRLLEWIASGRHGRCTYLERRADILLSPDHPDFLEGARSVIMISLSFVRPDPAPGRLGARVARHARGPDYHEVVARPLRSLLSGLRSRVRGLHGRVFVDTAPVMEKVWAQRAGLGWIGRNGLLVQPGLGSLTMLGGIVVDVEIEPDEPAPDGCGDCRACVDACPVGAIADDRLVDARACLSALTTMPDGDPSGHLAGRTAFGCDLCQEACPHNDGLPPGDPVFDPLPFMRQMSPRQFLALGKERAGELIEETALTSAGVACFMRNLAASLG
jgi:epoxyqueuosine reductase